MSEWIEEIYKEGLAIRFKKKADLFSGKSEFQKVQVAESTHHGRILLNDDCFMLSERDERIYHEMMAHVPLNVHPDPRRVLIIGGGDGGTAREVLRHKSIETCVLVEIDKMVIDACREHIDQTARVFSDSRLTTIVDDGVAYVSASQETFDVIMVDSTDPNGAAEPLFGPKFYSDLRRLAGASGIVVAQGESVFYEAEVQKKLLKTAGEFFSLTTMFNFTNMTYPGGLWSFMWASESSHPLKNIRKMELRDSGQMFYYNEEIHRAAFQLPEFQKSALAPWLKI
jgi:spermidine synthase